MKKHVLAPFLGLSVYDALQRLWGGAERFRRASSGDELNGGDRRTAYAGNEAKRARDMRKYPLWARWQDRVGL